jgi:hypothetical protein
MLRDVGWISPYRGDRGGGQDTGNPPRKRPRSLQPRQRIQRCQRLLGIRRWSGTLRFSNWTAIFPFVGRFHGCSHGGGVEERLPGTFTQDAGLPAFLRVIYRAQVGNRPWSPAASRNTVFFSPGQACVCPARSRLRPLDRRRREATKATRRVPVGTQQFSWPAREAVTLSRSLVQHFT